MTMTAVETMQSRVAWPRPTKLSDPWGDFTEDLLEAILATDDHEMTDYQFRQLFDPIMPAGSYEEVMYFLPLAFAYLADPQYDAYDLIGLLAAFTAKYREKLEAEGLLDVIHDCFEECLQIWTSTFIVIQHQVVHLPLVIATLHELLHIEIFINTGNGYGRVPTQVFPDVAHTFVRQLAENTSDPIKAAWFLAYAAAVYQIEQFGMFSEKDVLNQPQFDPILSLILDQEHLKRAAQLVSAHLPPNKETRRYWHRVFETLGLNSEAS